MVDITQLEGTGLSSVSGAGEKEVPRMTKIILKTLGGIIIQDLECKGVAQGSGKI